MEYQYCTNRQLTAYAARHKLDLLSSVRQLMTHAILPQQFLRNAGLLSLSTQQKLLDLPIFIAGLGGLGGEMAATLVQLGAANLFLCDFDCFEESNLNRQRFCNHDTLAQPKALVTAQYLKRKAPWGSFQPLVIKLTRENLPALLDSKALVIDCLDSIPAKQALEEAAGKAEIPWLHGSLLQLEGFVCLKPRPGGTMIRLFGDNCVESGAGSTLSHVVSGTAALMASLFKRWLENPAFESPLLHADFSIPEVETFQLPA